MSIEDSNFLNGVRFPRDKDDNPASVLVGLVDTLGGGHYKTLQIDPSTGALVSTVTVGPAVVPNPIYFLMHNGITAPQAFPVAALNRYSASGFKQLIIDIVMTGVGAYVNIQPIVWNPILNAYIPGDPSGRLSQNRRYVIDIQSPTDIYLLPIEVSGTVSITVAGC